MARVIRYCGWRGDYSFFWTFACEKRKAGKFYACEKRKIKRFYALKRRKYIYFTTDLAELSVGLELSKLPSHYRRDSLYYWQRESASGNAEVDFVFQKGEKIIPIEVKSGVRGSMQSLHFFLKEKSIDEGIRISLENFGKYQNYPSLCSGAETKKGFGK